MGKKTKEDERRKRHGEEERDKDYGFGWIVKVEDKGIIVIYKSKKLCY